MKKTITTRTGSRITLLGYKESNSIFFDSKAQIQITNNLGDDCEDEVYINIISTSEIDQIIQALQELKQTFPKQQHNGCTQNT